MKVITNTGGLAYTNCYVVADEKSGECVLFDAPDHTVGPLLDEIVRNKWKLIGLWLTHGHFDHLADHQVVTDRFPGTPILIHQLDEPKLIQPGSRMFPLPFTIPPGKPTGYVQDGQKLKIGSLDVEVIFTPGHSPGHVGYYFPNEHLLIGGDLIIGGSIGRTDLPDSNHAHLMQSIKRVMKLPLNTELLAGHGGPGSLKHEMQTNPYVQDAIRN